MGLIKEYYQIKKFNNAVYPKAYAIIENIFIKGKYARADFAVQSGRELKEGEEPIERVSIEFMLNRNESPFVTAYNMAKGMKKVGTKRNEDGSLEDVFEPNHFFGWDNHIVY